MLKRLNRVAQKIACTLLGLLIVFAPVIAVHCVDNIIKLFSGNNNLLMFLGVFTTVFYFAICELYSFLFSFRASYIARNIPNAALSDCNCFEYCAKAIRLGCYIVVALTILFSNRVSWNSLSVPSRKYLLIFTSILLFSCLRQDFFRLTFRKLPNVALALSGVLLFLAFATLSNPYNDALWGFADVSSIANISGISLTALKGSVAFAAISPAIIVLAKDIYERYRTEFSTDPQRTTRRKLLTHWYFSPRMPFLGDSLILLCAGFLCAFLVFVFVSFTLPNQSNLDANEELSASENPKTIVGINLFFWERHDNSSSVVNSDVSENEADSAALDITGVSNYIKSPERGEVFDVPENEEIVSDHNNDYYDLDSYDHVDTIVFPPEEETPSNPSRSSSILQALGWIVLALSFGGLAAHFDISDKQLCESESYYLRYHALSFFVKKPNLRQWNDYCQVFASLFLNTSPVYSEGYVWHDMKDALLTLCSLEDSYCGTQLLGRLIYLYTSAFESTGLLTENNNSVRDTEKKDTEKTTTNNQISQSVTSSRAECLLSSDIQSVVDAAIEKNEIQQIISPIERNQIALEEIRPFWEKIKSEAYRRVTVHQVRISKETGNLSDLISNSKPVEAQLNKCKIALDELAKHFSEKEGDIENSPEKATEKAINELKNTLCLTQEDEALSPLCNAITTAHNDISSLQAELSVATDLVDAQYKINTILEIKPAEIVSSMSVLSFLGNLQSTLFNTGLRASLRELLSSNNISSDDFICLIEKDVLSLLCRKQKSEDCLLSWLCTNVGDAKDREPCSFIDKTSLTYSLHNRRVLLLEYPLLILSCIQKRLIGFSPETFEEYIKEYYLALLEQKNCIRVSELFANEISFFFSSGKALYAYLQHHDEYLGIIRRLVKYAIKPLYAENVTTGDVKYRHTSVSQQDYSGFIDMQGKIREECKKLREGKRIDKSDVLGVSDSHTDNGEQCNRVENRNHDKWGDREDCVYLSLYIFYGRPESGEYNDEQDKNTAIM